MVRGFLHALELLEGFMVMAGAEATFESQQPKLQILQDQDQPSVLGRTKPNLHRI